MPEYVGLIVAGGVSITIIVGWLGLALTTWSTACWF